MIYQNYKINRVLLDNDEVFMELVPNVKRLRLKVKGTREAADTAMTLCSWISDKYNAFAIEDEDNGKKFICPSEIDAGEVVCLEVGLEVLNVEEVEE